MKRGFTLTELLTVIVIISLLAAIVIPNLSRMREKGRDAERITDVNNLQIALERYYDRNSTYPRDEVDSCSSDWNSLSLRDLVTAGLISSLPLDPKNSSPHCYEYQVAEDCSGGTVAAGYSIYFTPEDIDSLENNSAGAVVVGDKLCVDR